MKLKKERQVIKDLNDATLTKIDDKDEEKSEAGSDDSPWYRKCKFVMIQLVSIGVNNWLILTRKHNTWQAISFEQN